MRRSIGFLAFLLASCAATPPPHPVAPSPVTASIEVPPAPPARVDAVVENLHGIEVRDPYRWMEKGGEEMNAWLEAQGKRSRAVFDALPRRAEMLAAVTAADL